jgi:hypothetical protein
MILRNGHMYAKIRELDLLNIKGQGLNHMQTWIHKTRRGPWPKIGGSHHLPFYYTT